MSIEIFNYVSNTIASGARSTQLLFNHRNLLNTRVYSVRNRSDRPESLDASFRVRGKASQFWYADDGRIEEFTAKGEDQELFRAVSWLATTACSY
tara:strand:+ start:49621 stop:49905 length:285 start_codon:yes stop_codon:yes gene_type:complete